jgi:hypothetical protein
MGYKILGYAVWHGGKFYVRRRYGGGSPTKRYAALGLVALGVGALVLRGSQSHGPNTP